MKKIIMKLIFFLLLISFGASSQTTPAIGMNYFDGKNDLPPTEFLRVDTIKGFVQYPSKGKEAMIVEIGTKFDSVFKEYFDDYHNPNTITRVAPGVYQSTLMGGGWSVGRREKRKTFRIVTSKKELNLNKYFQFVPEDNFQD